MQKKHVVIGGLTAVSLAVIGWFSLPDDAQNAVKDTLGMTQSAPVATAHTSGKTLDQVLTDWGKDTRTVINGHPVPPIPDPKINNSTVTGVDSDKNGIRDDIDRRIADMFGNDPRYEAVVSYEKAMEFSLSNPTHANGQKAVDQAMCIFSGLYADYKTEHRYNLAMSKLTHLTVDTPARGRAYAAAWAGMGVGECPHK